MVTKTGGKRDKRLAAQKSTKKEVPKSPPKEVKEEYHPTDQFND